MNTLPQQFKDKNWRDINVGDALILNFYARWRERPGKKRIATDNMSGQDGILADEGGLQPPKGCWVEYKVKWSGACLILDREGCSDFQALMGAELFDEKGKSISTGAGFYYMNKGFDSTVYKLKYKEWSNYTAHLSDWELQQTIDC